MAVFLMGRAAGIAVLIQAPVKYSYGCQCALDQTITQSSGGLRKELGRQEFLSSPLCQRAFLCGPWTKCLVSFSDSCSICNMGMLVLTKLPKTLSRLINICTAYSECPTGALHCTMWHTYVAACISLNLNNMITEVKT